MAISRSPGCNCCGAAPPEPCVCCESAELKPSPTFFGTFSQTTWDDGWEGVSNKNSNTLPANSHAYYDIVLKCNTNWSVEVEVIDFGTSSGAKIWCEGSEVENYCMDGNECVVTCLTGASFGIATTSPLSFGGSRYVAAILSSTLVSGGAQRYGSSIADATLKRINDGEVFFFNQYAHALWHGEQTGIETKTIRINIQTGSSDIEIGQVAVKYGTSECAKSQSHTSGNNSTFGYIMTDAQCVNTGASDVTVIEDSEGTVLANGDIFCPDPDPRPCPAWQNRMDVNYSAMNGTFIYSLERQTNYCDTFLDNSVSPVYESVPASVLSDWVSSIQSWDFDNTTRPIKFWEYFLTEPLVDTSASSNSYDDDWYDFTPGSVCHIGSVTLPSTFVPDPTRLATPSVDPPVITFNAFRQVSFGCKWVDLCRNFVYPGFIINGDGVQDKVRQPIARTTELANVSNSFTVSDISFFLDQTDQGCSTNGDWTLDVNGTGFTMDRTITYTHYEHSLDDNRASSVTPSTKAGTVTNLVVNYTSGSTTANQVGSSYVPSLTFIAGPDTGGCNPDNSYDSFTSTPTQSSTYPIVGTIKAGQWVRVNLDNGDMWDISIGRLGFDSFETVIARKHDNCDTVTAALVKPADRCDPFSVSLSDSQYSITFDLEWV